MHSVSVRIISVAASLCAVFFMAVTAQAAFQVVENFDDLALGNINGQNGWLATPGSGFVVLDPSSSNNQALKVITESGNLVAREESITGFDQIEAGFAFNVTVRQGEEYRVLISVDHNLV